MDFNQYNSNLNQQVPPYPQPSFDFRSNNPIASDPKQTILTTKDSENSFVNAVLRTALNKEARFYFSYPDSIKWRDMMYEGKLVVVGEDYIVIREKATNQLYVLLMLYLEFIVFEEE